MKKLNVGLGDQQKGITLIALIITIIVMLILVAVTINVALNGGIFDRAEDATQKTSREVAREQIIAAMIGAYDNNGNFVKANVELPEGVKWCKKSETYENATNNYNECNYVITEKGEVFYVVQTDGTVLDEEPQDDLIPTNTEKAAATYIDKNAGTHIYTMLENETAIIYYTEMPTNAGHESIQLIIAGDDGYNDAKIYYWFCNASTATNFNNETRIN